MLASAVPASAYAADAVTVNTHTQAPERTISALGIMRTSSLGAFVTRGQLAEMLVNASSYKGNIDWAAQTAPFADVSSDHWAAGYIQLAVSNGWMYGYLGGKFKPDEAVSLQEAAYGVTALLGYTNADFTGNQLLGRMNLFYDKNLDENITRNVNETITRKDCMNLFYNLLKATNKTGIMYGTAVFECNKDATTGEIDYLALMDEKRVGPLLVDAKLSNILPFPVSDATFYVDNRRGDRFEVEKGDVIYYSKAHKTVWVHKYSTESGQVNPDNVFYANGGLTPTSVIFEGETYILDNSAVAYEFSTFGDAASSEQTITIIYETRVTADEQELKYITGVIIPGK